MSSHSTSSLFHIVYKQSCNFSNNKLVLPHRFDSNESLRAATSSDNAQNRSSSHFLITNFPFWFIPFPFELASHHSCLEHSELLTVGEVDEPACLAAVERLGLVEIGKILVVGEDLHGEEGTIDSGTRISGRE